ncbi:MAG: bifunctional DNA-binding transcriptional regulator/O6-methylguanine-DNA methyltransferase Ada [Porticoccaceae bacterium]
MSRKSVPSSVTTAPTTKLENDFWLAVTNRDAKADGRFFYAVKTTGVYCRPSCGARTPKRENTFFYLSRADAEKAGFRPCKRCKPEQLPLTDQRRAMITGLCRYIEEAESPPSLSTLAERANLSPYHLHRLFKKMTGLTPKAYAIAHRANKMREGLNSQSSITDAIFDAGYNASSGFYTKADQLLGMTPSRYRQGGFDVQIQFAVGQCSLGSILVAASDKGICAILMGDSPDELINDLEKRFPKAEFIGGDRDFEQRIALVIGLVETPQSGLNLPLDIRGTAFQQRVWQALQTIPAGSTLSYSQLAERIGAPESTRAVANACAANPLAIAIPCHRVVRSDGSLSGYRWGIERKRTLLNRESTHSQRQQKAEEC